jgi:hypothetical protein
LIGGEVFRQVKSDFIQIDLLNTIMKPYKGCNSGVTVGICYW